MSKPLFKIIIGVILLLAFIGFEQTRPTTPTHSVIRNASAQQTTPDMISGIGKLLVNMYGIKEDIAFEYAKTIVSKAYKHGFDPVLIVSIIHHESRFDPNANSGSGTGLMQIVHKYHKQKVPKKSDLFDPDINIQTGVRILSEYRNISKTESDAILRYNGTLGKSTAYLDKIRRTQKKLTQEIEQYI